MRMVLGALLLGHGAAHVVGFVVPWRLITSAEGPSSHYGARGSLDLGLAGVRVLGLLWLLAGSGVRQLCCRPAATHIVVYAMRSSSPRSRSRSVRSAGAGPGRGSSRTRSCWRC